MKNQLDNILIRLRRELHKYPDLSGSEEGSCSRIQSFLEALPLEDLPSKKKKFSILNGLGGGGLAAVIDSGSPGPVLMLRAETDALPIEEPPLFSHASVIKGVSHKCGHDGHMSILAGTAAAVLEENPVRKGKLILLFQPSEETGTGAQAVLEDRRFKDLEPDLVFALHNWPGIPRGEIRVREGSMFCASTGLIISLRGKSSHASLPEEGISPVEGLKRIHSLMAGLHTPDRSSKEFSLITTAGIRAGGEDFGISPGEGALYLTVRASRQEVLEGILSEIQNRSRMIAREEGLKAEFSFKDSFPESRNSPEAAALVIRAAQECGFPAEVPAQGVASSEDIGHLLKRARRGGAVFLLGSGTSAPPLHSRDYDFDDALIKPGVEIFLHLIQDILG